MSKDKGKAQNMSKRENISANESERMNSLEIISRMCEVTNVLSDIVNKQQIIIEQSKIEEAVKADLRQQVGEAERELDVIEYHSRRYCDTDDIEATFGKETAIDD